MSEARTSGSPVVRVARAVVAVALLVALSTSAAAAMQAQANPAAAARDALERRIRANEDSLVRIEARLADVERAARADTRDTVRAGVVVLATSAQFTASAREALAAAWPALRRQWGDIALARAYAGAVVRVLAPAPLVAVVRNGRVEHEQHLEISKGDTAAAFKGFFAALTAELVQERADATFSGWLLRGRLAEPAPDYQAAFVDLVTAPALVNRQCAGGDAGRCRQALGLVSVSEPEATWYTDEDRRVVARAWWRARQHPSADGEPPQNPCAPTPITTACRAFIATLAPAVWMRPLGTEARMTLLHVVTELGGDGAFSRLVADTAQSMEARLAAAAARPLDEVMLEWRTRVMRAHPEPVRPRLTLLLGSTLLCLAALVLVSVRQERA